MVSKDSDIDTIKDTIKLINMIRSSYDNFYVLAGNQY